MRIMTFFRKLVHFFYFIFYTRRKIENEYNNNSNNNNGEKIENTISFHIVVAVDLLCNNRIIIFSSSKNKNGLFE